MFFSPVSGSHAQRGKQYWCNQWQPCAFLLPQLYCDNWVYYLIISTHTLYSCFAFLGTYNLSLDRLHMILIYVELVPIAVILKQANFVTWQNLDNLSYNTKYKIFSSFLGTSTESVYRLLRISSSGLPLWLVILFGQ